MPREVTWAISFAVGAILLAIGWKYFFVLVTLHVLVCLVLMAVILLQGGEAADLAGAFGGSGSQTAFGPRAAATFLSRATTWCAVMFMFTTMALTVHVTSTTPGGRSVLEQFSQPAAPATAPAAPPAAPAPGTPPANQTQPATPAPAPQQQPAAPAPEPAR
jgi:preprotein translocase subunit SecG